MTPHDQLFSFVTDRPGWVMDGDNARYASDTSAWSARVRPTLEPRNRFTRWHVSCCDPAGVARYALMAHTPTEALKFAETVIAAQPASRGRSG